MPYDNPPAPDWVVEGLRVVRFTFGPGTVRGMRPHQRVHAIWIEFDGAAGGKSLSPLTAMAHLRPEAQSHCFLTGRARVRDDEVCAWE